MEVEMELCVIREILIICYGKQPKLSPSASESQLLLRQSTR